MVVIVSGHIFLFQMSAMVGLLTRCVWIFPSWLTVEQPHSKTNIEIGYVRNKSAKHICNCGFQGNQGLCEFNDSSIMPQSECIIKANLMTEVIHELSLLKSLNTHHQQSNTEENPRKHIDSTYKDNKYKEATYKDLSDNYEVHLHIPSNASIIWDIDLDYFGCIYTGQALVDVGIKWKLIELLDSKLLRLFCPTKMEDENLSDIILKRTIRDIIEACKFTSKHKRCAVPFEQVHALIEKSRVNYWKEFSHLFCTKNETWFKTNWRNILFIVHYLDETQMQALLKIGFCLTTTLQTYGWTDNAVINVCHGNNPPGSNIVQVYQPTMADIDDRMIRLEQILKFLPSPDLVTVCRSGRDGYTPREYLQYIESGVIEVIRRAKSKHRFNIVYDRHLLGGEAGWSGRLQV